MIDLVPVTSRQVSSRVTAVALLALTLLALFVFFAPQADAEATAVTTADHLLHVNHAASGTGDGLSWDNAFPKLQDALTLAATLAPTQTVEIWVAQGVYYPDEGVGYTNNNRQHAFYLHNNIALYGGFAGGETAREERDWNSRPTVLSGDIEQNDTVRPDGITNSTTDIVGNNSYNVVRADQVNNTAVLDGFAITAGLADRVITLGAHRGHRGGGLSLASGTLTLNNLLFQGNRAHATSGTGGGVYVFAGSLTVENVAFRYNDAYVGGALYINRHDHPDFSDFKQVAFLYNDAVYGGAFSSANGSNHTFENIVFAGNSASLDGGALYIGSDFPSFRNVIVAGNYAANNGGGYFLNASAPRITNVTLTGNRAGNEGGAIYRESATGNFTYLHNTIVWNNEDSSGVGTPSATHGGPGATRFVVDYSLMQGMLPAGAGNLDGADPANDPLFIQAVDPATAPTSVGDVRILRGSPVIDKGNNQAPINGVVYPFVPLEGNVLTDLDGFARIIDGDNDSVATVDLGVYEAQQPNVELTKMVEPVSGAVAAGTAVTYTLTFTNTGLDVAANVIITDSMPTDIEIWTVTSSGAMITATAGYPHYAWQISDLQPDEGGTIVLSGRVSPAFTGGGVLVNTAVITATYDTPLTDNLGTASLTVCPSHVIVQNASMSGAGSLRQAITDVCDGGLITFDPSLNNGDIFLNTGTALGKAITIDGSDARLLEIYGNIWNINSGGHLTTRDIHFYATRVNVNDDGRLTSDRTLWKQIDGIQVAAGGHATLQNSAVADSSSLLAYGIVNIETGGTAVIHHTTITDNYAGGDTGGIVNNGTLTLTHSIVSDNTGDASPHEISGNGAFISRYNLLGVNSQTNAAAFSGTFVPHATDITATSDGANPTPISDIFPVDGSNNPLLADNGGPTLSLALQPTAPAIDLAPLTDCLPTDQRGYFRPSGAGCDAGAYEAQLGGALPGGDGPGGVGNSLGQTGLRLWLRTASDMSGNVATWADQSGYDNDATQATMAHQPTIFANSYNGLPALQFDGADDFLATSAISALNTNQQTIFVVGQSGNSGIDIFLRSAYSGGTSGSTFANNHLVGLFNDGVSDVVHARSSAGGFVAGSASGSAAPRLHALQWHGDAISYFQNGQLADSVTGANAAPTGHITTHLGRNYENSGALNGRLAEVIIFNQTLNRAQINLVNNYLSARYDLPLTANNFYTGSLASNGDYDWDVAGIGRESDGSHEEARSGGLIIQNNSFLQDDGDYLMAGHDGAANEVVTADWMDRRWSRVWACTKTDAGANGGTVNLIFDFSDAGMAGDPPVEPASDYQLLKRDGTSGTFTAVATATAIIGDRVIFENVDTADLCSYLTLGALNEAPLAVQLHGVQAQAGNAASLWLGLVVILLALTAVVLVATKLPGLRDNGR